MQLAVYILVYPWLWLISKVPFKIIYFISDGIYLLMYYAIGYRKSVVRNNLALVFPEKSEEQRLYIEKKFYRHMCDMFLEMIKTIGISNKQLQKRFTFSHLEVLHRLEAKNKSVMLIFPHYASWEWVIALDRHIASKGYAIYQKVGNKYFDRLVRNIRQKFGTTLISTKDTWGIVAQNKRDGKLGMYGILSDQSPMVKKALLWTPFMGITVPAHTGAETLCKKFELPAVYLKVNKVKRGHYHGTFKLITEHPKEMDKFELTKSFLKMVEESIKEAPEYYLWTHKRWKHMDKKPKKAYQSQKIRP
ncbi:lysophospholipid acyltransferase family protein [Muricauda sp. 334s03]|uniref:Lysophospholipid acyltransferase family protein n=2 Tax=Flagellimonas TaxID=444459 RepID=A0ABT5XNQ6_9FLAO|nr:MULTISPECIES: lysophospholipid acyltransferase family protein [Allomuricauda]MDF0707435.1 lysophospholipid acyltransferase family protein [[Muricauda] okinawensis]MDF0715335.1 lysophospholipid acyltransferase family protein [[Muricauda] yonaguniensis]